jgi:Skp family chaperone for outer membrane proteins
MAIAQRSSALLGSLAIGMALSLSAAPVAAALYKWVDANGRVVYSDQRPTGNFKAEVVGAAPPPSNPDAVKEMTSKEAELKKRQLDRAEDAKKSEKARAETQKLAAFCSQARSQVAGLQRVDMVMFRLNEKGERVALDDAARKAEAERLEQMMRERKCS